MTRSRESGILVLARVSSLLASDPKTASKRSLNGLSFEQACRKYKGFDGSPWPQQPDQDLPELQHGLLSIEQMPKALEYLRKLPEVLNSEIIVLAPDKNLQSTGKFVGFDVGYYLSEFNFYSSIMNEILFGCHEELRAFEDQLNENLLFSERAQANSYIQVRNKLVEAGRELEVLEVDEKLNVIGIDLIEIERRK